MTKYEKSDTEATRLNALVAEGKSLADQNETNTMNNLLRVANQSILGALTALHQELNTNCLNDGKQINAEVTGKLAGAKTVLQEVALACHSQAQKQQGILHDPQNLISDWYDYSNAANTAASCRESDIKHLKIFDGTSKTPDLDMEELLVNLNSVGAQLKLNELGLKSALMRKLVGEAHLVIKTQVDLQNFSITEVPFKTLIAIVEAAYMRNSDPESARQSLLKLKKLPDTQTNFINHQALILRLATLAVKDKPLPDRKKLWEQTALHSFVNSLGEKHKTLVSLENSRRIAEGQPTMGISIIANYLERREKDTAIKTPQAPYSSSANRVQEWDTENYNQLWAPETTEDDNNQANWAGRGRSRARGFRGGRSRPTPGRWASNQGPTRFQQQRGNPRFQRGRGTPHQPSPANRQDNQQQNRGRGQFQYQGNPNRGRLGQYQGTPNRGRGQAHNLPGPINETCQKLGVQQGACWLCGNTSHRLGATNCPYHGAELKTTPCRSCGQGGHMTHLCIGRIGGQAVRNREARVAGQEEPQDLDLHQATILEDYEENHSVF